MEKLNSNHLSSKSPKPTHRVVPACSLPALIGPYHFTSARIRMSISATIRSWCFDEPCAWESILPCCAMWWNQFLRRRVLVCGATYACASRAARSVPRSQVVREILDVKRNFLVNNVLASYILTVLSSDADPNALLSGEKVTALTEPEWPWSVCRSAPDPASHILTMPSSESDVPIFPSGEKATVLTEPKRP